MRVIRRSCLVVLGLSVLTGSAHAQARDIQAGARIKFSGDQVTGIVTAIVLERHGDTLKVLSGSTAPFDVSMSELRTLRVSQGKSRAMGAGVGALWGAGINFLATGIIIASGAECGDCDTDVDGASVALSFVSGAFTGALVGVLIGKETWAQATIPQRASLQARAGHRTVGLGVRIAM